MIFKCPYCNKEFPDYYVNKGVSYWGDRGRYNFRGAKANFNRHMKSCKEKASPEQKEKALLVWQAECERLYGDGK